MNRQQWKAIGYALFPAIPLLAPLGWMIGTAWLLPIAVFVAIPVFDRLIGADRTNSEDVARNVRGSGYFDAIPLVFIPIWLGCLAWGAELAARTLLTPLEWLGIALSLGIMSAFSTCAAHELLHRPAKRDQWSARLIMAVCAYGSFAVEHLHHHLRVGFVDSGTTPLPGESAYRFVYRNVLHTWHHAALMERERMAKKGAPFWTNRLFRLNALTLAIVIGAAVAWGGQGVILFAIQAAFAVFSLEMINYFEHYGLVRDDGEPVSARMAWNSNGWLTNALTLNITRHSDHHLNPGTPYQDLRAQPDGPQLPAGYFAIFGLALIPPLWRRVMHKRLTQHTSVSAS